ncbi:glycoside hydrolase family 2 [Chitinophaga polysaccharea]|uniref:glycoside hydrolase family 2 protein n=1 Tax=Chitinophaga TaxID=79328 RepID=UPI001454FF36|nr:MULTISPECIES: glycoside hydrolase family 2 TIM barrel-domain containing protein [Chitinophaga]NLR58552.1 glycoside hydrolase family 2 [Chitinophaga polysaccharea]NLU91080.1 glycoside hydrolase family 2 [Chitinophaga sp. Ak27]
MLTRIALLLLATLCLQSASAQETQRIYLSGTDKDHTVDWDFYCSGGRKSGQWTTIPVPSNWEQQGFGGYNYGHDKVKADEKGSYRYRFDAPANWQQQQVSLVFDGVMTDADVKINGRAAGAIHQGGFYRFSYDISKLLRKGSNLLEVTVSKMSANASVNRAERNGDFWVLGGIYRPVYLEVKPRVHINHLAINATAKGDFTVQVFTNNLPSGYSVSAQIFSLDGKPLQEAVTANEKAYTTQPNERIYTLQQQVARPRTWSAEFPHRYRAVIQVKNGAQVVHSVTQPFGFRTIAVRPRDGIYVNGVRVLLKGVNRHSAWPETGRTLSKDISILDVNLMKDMNMNAVRMSHYPPDEHFLDVCDSLGLFVLDELTGWQAAYDTVIGRRLVKELVVRDVNHPSIIFWDNGNEGGFNRALDGDYALYDPQQRPVLHPWERYSGIDTKHYPDYNYVVNSSLYDQQDILMPTEFMHGLYDGGMGAGLQDFWARISQHPRGGGGFLWVLADEGLVRTDKDGWIDTDGNHAPDGIVGPHREKEGSFYAIKDTWSPVQISLPVITAAFNGRIPVENCYDYTPLSQCGFRWQLLRLPSPGKDNRADTISAGYITAPALAPHTKGFLQLAHPRVWDLADVLYITVTDPYGRAILQKSWPLRLPAPPAATGNGQQVAGVVSGDTLTVAAGNTRYAFSRTSGQLMQIVANGQVVPLSGGPVLAGVTQTLQQFSHSPGDSGYIVTARYEGNGFLQVKWTIKAGVPAQLDYSYSVKGETPFTGITFNYPESAVKGMAWIGEGPYRVWKNRLQGQQFGSWYKTYNNTVTGESWEYPEFKGYHAQVHRATFYTTGTPVTFYIGNEGTFLQVFRPLPPKGAGNNHTAPAFPEGDIGFMSAISPIGTKFQEASRMGPESQGNLMLNYTPVSGRIWIDAGM